MSQLVDDSLDFVTGLFASSLPSTCLYHNLTHTKRVLKSTKEIIVNSNLNDEEIEVLELAAILHDTGYIKGSLEHEIVSVDIATKFLREHAVNEDLIKQVTSCILILLLVYNIRKNY
jgi:HD superfamily phosphodiesterase